MNSFDEYTNKIKKKLFDFVDFVKNCEIEEYGIIFVP